MLFDVLGTLVTLEPSLEIRITDGLRSLGLRPTLDIGETLRTLTLWPVETPDPAEGFSRWTRYVRALLRLITGCPDGDPVVAAIVNGILDPQQYRPLPHALEALEELMACGLRVGLVTNADPWIRKVPALVELAPRLSAFVVSTEIGRRKPDPVIFQIALDESGVQPTHAWFVGDSLETDVRGATGAGMTGIMVRTIGSCRDIDVPCVPNLKALLPALESLPQ